MNWVLFIVFALILLAFAIGFLVEFTPVHLHTFQTRCPACGQDGLEPLETARTRGRLPLLLCARCGVEFREELDGTLTTVTPS